MRTSERWLKSMVCGGKKRHVTVNTRLASKPAGCVIWYDYDPATLKLGPLRLVWRAAGSGSARLRTEGSQARQAYATGTKGLRAGHRVVPDRASPKCRGLRTLVPFLPGLEMETLLDRLCIQLVAGLKSS